MTTLEVVTKRQKLATGVIKKVCKHNVLKNRN
jgi:hypothetical protein